MLGPAVTGARLVFIGDTGRVDNLVPEIAGADLLAIESTYTQEEKDVAHDFGHLTAAQGAWLARTGDVKYLVLHHVSRRYRSSQILEEAQAVFPNTVVAKDFDLFRVVKHKLVEHEDVRQRPGEADQPIRNGAEGELA